MVRRPSAAKNKEKAHLAQNTNSSSEDEELKRQNMNESMAIVEQQLNMQENSANLSSKKGAKPPYLKVRWSRRLYDTTKPEYSQDIDRVIEEVAISESEKEEDDDVDELAASDDIKVPDLAMKDGRNMDEKLDYIIQLLEEQQKAGSSASEGVSQSYKSLYFDSQKQLEALTNDNYVLSIKLEDALGKIEAIEALKDENHQLSSKLQNALHELEAYEKGSRVYSDMLEKLKDVMLAANLAKTDEKTINLSSLPVGEVHTSLENGEEDIKTSAAKRKRVTKERKRN